MLENQKRIMKNQNVENHRKFTPLHHFIFSPLSLGAIIYSSVQAVSSDTNQEIWIFLTLISILLTILGIMVRTQYGLKNQNRIIRLEMRLKYYQLTNQPFDELEKKLELGQIFALRFASDNELVDLINKSIAENLSPTEIKKSIKTWNPDFMRV